MSENNLNIKNLFSDLMLVNPVNAQLRQRVLDQFELPTRQNEEWKYTSLKPLLNNWKLSTQGKIPKTKIDDNCIRIYSRNGFFDIAEVKEALQKFPIEVENAESALDLIPQKTFWHLSHAFLQEGLRLKIRDKAQIPLPIVIEHQMDGQNLFVHPFIVVVIGQEANIQMMENFLHSQENIWINSAFKAQVGEGSVFNFYKTYAEEKASSHIDNNFFIQKSSSTLRFASLSLGSQLLRNDAIVELSGKNAHCDLRGLAILAEKNQMGYNVHVHHQVGESTSRQLFKSILNDESHYVFQGNVKIDSAAQKTDAAQLNKNLLLGKKCRVDTKPQLDVYADDVKATHGSATGQMNPEEKFYLESRGLHPDLANSLLNQGFAMDTFLDLPKSFLKDEFLKGIVC